jgi:excisionase family DNA binding protein
MGDVVRFPDGVIERALTYAELSEVLGMSERWIRARVAEGMPSHLYARKARRFRLSEVQRWLEERYPTARAQVWHGSGA